MKLVYVEWWDSYGCASNWSDFPESDPKPLLCRSVGWMAYETAKCVVIVPHMAPALNQGMGDMCIPRCAIHRIEQMEEPADAAK